VWSARRACPRDRYSGGLRARQAAARPAALARAPCGRVSLRGAVAWLVARLRRLAGVAARARGGWGSGGRRDTPVVVEDPSVRASAPRGRGPRPPPPPPPPPENEALHGGGPWRRVSVEACHRATEIVIRRAAGRRCGCASCARRTPEQRRRLDLLSLNGSAVGHSAGRVLCG